MKNRRLRKLMLENMESRRLLAGRVFAHNFADPEDVNADGLLAPIDALVVINRLNEVANEANSPALAEEAVSEFFTDVNADEILSPHDALLVINRLNDDESMRSGAPMANRIARLESALAANELPPHLNSENAAAILEMLRNGERPESHRHAHRRMLDGLLDRIGGLSEEQQNSLANLAASALRSVIESDSLPTLVDAAQANELLTILENEDAGQRLADLRSFFTELVTPETVTKVRAELIRFTEGALDDDAISSLVNPSQADSFLQHIREGRPPRLAHLNIGGIARSLAPALQDVTLSQLREHLDTFRDLVGEEQFGQIDWLAVVREAAPNLSIFDLLSLR